MRVRSVCHAMRLPDDERFMIVDMKSVQQQLSRPHKHLLLLLLLLLPCHNIPTKTLLESLVYSYRYMYINRLKQCLRMFTNLLNIILVLPRVLSSLLLRQLPAGWLTVTGSGWPDDPHSTRAVAGRRFLIFVHRFYFYLIIINIKFNTKCMPSFKKNTLQHSIDLKERERCGS